MPFNPVLPDDLIALNLPINLRFRSGNEPESVASVGFGRFENGAEVEAFSLPVVSQTQDEAQDLIVSMVRAYYNLPDPAAKVPAPETPTEKPVDDQETQNPDDGNGVETPDESGGKTRVSGHGRKRKQTGSGD